MFQESRVGISAMMQPTKFLKPIFGLRVLRVFVGAGIL
jgi:hypothetical protein